MAPILGLLPTDVEDLDGPSALARPYSDFSAICGVNQKNILSSSISAWSFVFQINKQILFKNDLEYTFPFSADVESATIHLCIPSKYKDEFI